MKKKMEDRGKRTTDRGVTREGKLSGSKRGFFKAAQGLVNLI
jgi:hypothetical protein